MTSRAASLLFLLLASSLFGQRPVATPPNVVVLYIDDLGYADIGSFGCTRYPTPHTDRLAREGVRLTDFYVAQPVCSASRASLLTGCYPNRIGIHGALGPRSKTGIHADETTLAELLKEKGYATAIFGKWHLGDAPKFLPLRHGFDEFYGIPYSNDMWPFHPESPKAWSDLPTFDQDRVVALNGDQTRFTTDFTERAVSFIERASRDSKRFFLYLAHPMPHVPLFVSTERAGQTGAGLFADVVHEIDWSVGRVMDALARTGHDADTLVLFASDNGPWLSYGDHAGSAGPLREGKGTTFEGGVRVPFLARWPGRIPAGSTCREPAMTIDVLPTIAGIVGAELPKLPIDGRDIAPLLFGTEGARSPHEALYFWYHQAQLEAMRSGRWKLHFPHGYRSMDGRAAGAGGIPGKYDYARKTGLELYDLTTDVGESRDVAAQHPEVLARLTAMADEKRQELGDALSKIRGTAVRSAGVR